MPSDDMTYPQAPVMTAEHVAAMRWVVSEWPYANVRFDRRLLDEIHAHLTALLVQHTLTPYEVITHASNYTPPSQTFTSWLQEYDHLDADDVQSDQ